MIFVSTIVVMAMSAMFVACSSKSIENGCTCTFSAGGESETIEYSPEQMRGIAAASAEEGYIIKTCEDLQKMHIDVMKRGGGESNVSVKCR